MSVVTANYFKWQYFQLLRLKTSKIIDKIAELKSYFQFYYICVLRTHILFTGRYLPVFYRPTLQELARIYR